jgi:opacity protein-like surface antigen
MMVDKTSIIILAMLLSIPVSARAADKYSSEYSNFVRQAYEPPYETERRRYYDERKSYPDEELDGEYARTGRAEDEYYNERYQSYPPPDDYYNDRDAYPARRRTADAEMSRDRRTRSRGYYDEREDGSYYQDQRYSSDRRYPSNRPAENNSDRIRPFLGLDISNFAVKFNDSGDDELGTKYNAYTLNFGAKFTKWIGAELFYKATLGKSVDISLPGGTAKAETSFSGIGVGMNAYIPLSDTFNFEPTIGLGSYKGKTELTCNIIGVTCGTSSDDGSKMGIMLGVGVSAAVGENFDIRLGYRTTMFSEKEFSMKNFSEIYLGFRGMF